MRTAVIVDAVRTPLGKRNGRLREWHPVDLAAELLNAVRDRNDLDPAVVDDVVLGCVMQVGEQAANIAWRGARRRMARHRARRRSTASAARASRRPISPPRA